MGLNQQWMDRDLKVLWHPCTQMKDHEQLPLIPIKRGEGAVSYTHLTLPTKRIV